MKTLTDKECRTIVDGIAEYLGNKLHAADFLKLADDPFSGGLLENYEIELDELLKGALMESGDSSVFFKMLLPYLGKMIANNVQNAMPGLALNVSLPEFDLEANKETAP